MRTPAVALRLSFSIPIGSTDLRPWLIPVIASRLGSDYV